MVFHMRLFILATLSLAILLPVPALGQAANDCAYGDLEIPLPVEQLEGKNICEILDEFNGDGNDVTSPIRAYAAFLANLIIAAIVGLGLIMIVIGGYLYMTAGGAADRIQTAKKVIGAALLGIIIALLSFVILNTINPGITGNSATGQPSGQGAAGPEFDISGAAGESGEELLTPDLLGI